VGTVSEGLPEKRSHRDFLGDVAKVLFAL